MHCTINIYLFIFSFVGWEYSAAIFVGFNFIGFLVIGIGYSVMYISINNTMAMARGTERKKQIKLAKNMMIIVMTDFVCWLPIIAMGKWLSMSCLSLTWVNISLWAADHCHR